MSKSHPPLTPDEARQALELIEATARQMRRFAAYGGMAYFLLLWGTVWLLGFGANHFVQDPAMRGRIWTVLDLLGLAGTGYVVWWLHKTRQGIRWGFGSTLGWFWITWMGYGLLFIYFAQPQDGTLLSMLLSLWAMYGYVVSGLLFRSRLLVGLGLTVTAFIVVGYLALPAYFNLWMALFGGGSLIVAGGYILSSWR